MSKNTPDGLGVYEAPPYKVEWSGSRTISAIQEFDYLQAFFPDLTFGEYHAEVESWKEVHEFPAMLDSRGFRIFSGLAHLHYGYEQEDNALLI